MNFNESTLYISKRSPFARRVRVAFKESRIPYQELMFDVLKPNPEVMAVNPLGRVPTLVLKSGDVLIESSLILSLFYRTNSSPLFPVQDPHEQCLLCYWMGLASGIADKAIEYFFESSRPKEQIDSLWIDEILLTTGNAFQAFENALRTKAFLVGNALSQAELDLGIAMNYFSLRVNSHWKEKFPHILKMVETLNLRDSFIQTQPE